MEYILNIEHDNATDLSDPDYVPESEMNIEKDKLRDGDEYYDSDNEKSNTCLSKKKLWGDYEINQRLLELLQKIMPKVGRSGQFTTKKVMNEYIANKLSTEFGENFTGDQVCNRAKSLSRGKKKYSKYSPHPSIKVKNSKQLSIDDVSNYNLESLYDSVEEEEDICSIDNSSKKQFTNQHSKKLIRLYNMFIPNVRSNIRFRTKKEIFEAISEELEYEFKVKYTPIQCESRYKSIVRKARKLILKGGVLKLKDPNENNSKKRNPNEKVNISEYNKNSDENVDFLDDNDSQKSISMKNKSIVDYDNNTISSFHPFKNEEEIVENNSGTNFGMFNNSNIAAKNYIDDDESYESDVNEKFNSTNSNKKAMWGSYQVNQRLLELFRQIMPKVGKCGQFTTKKEMYEYIAKKLNLEFDQNYTGEQVHNRSKCFNRGKKILKKYFNSSDQKSKFGDAKLEKLSSIDISNYNLESLYDDDDEDDFAQEFTKEQSLNPSKPQFTNQHSKKLIQLYNMFIPNVGSNFKFRTKKELFENISEELEHAFQVKFTPTQCESRYKTIVRKAKKLILKGEKLELKNSNNTDTNKSTAIATFSEDDQVSDEERDMFNQDMNLRYERQTSVPIKDDLVYHDNDDNDTNSMFHAFQNEEDPIKNDNIINEDLDQFNNKLLKFCHKDLMKQYLEYKEKKLNYEQSRHNEIMQELRKINETLLEIKYQSSFYDNS